MFENIHEKLEAKAAPESEVDKLIVTDLAKTDRWKAKRVGKITSSTLPALKTRGRGSIAWGKTAIDVLYGVKYELRTGNKRESNDNIYQFKWGKENEPRAIEWLKRNGYPDIKHSDDFEDIIFNTPFEGFGDSPDFIGEKIVGEIKCHIDQVKIEKYRELTEITPQHENYAQFLGHFIGMPEAEKLIFVSYDAYTDNAHVVEMLRDDHAYEIAVMTQRIKDGYEAVKKSLSGEIKLSEINEVKK